MKFIELCSRMPEEVEDEINQIILESKPKDKYSYKKM
jgi:hypothetical protein